MAGKRAVEGATYVTPRVVYRNNITVAGETDPTSNSIPVLDTTLPPNVNIGLGQADGNQYGKDARIMISALVQGWTSVTLDLWMLADIQGASLNTNPPPTPTLPTSPPGSWIKVASQVITASNFWILKDIPPGQYKVLLNAASGGAGQFLTLLAQYAA